MAKWFFEPGHTAAEFSVRHMMVTHVRGHFKNIHGTLFFDPATPTATSVEATIDATGIWTGEADRDVHLKSADFLDVERHPQITFKGNKVELAGASDAVLTGELTRLARACATSQERLMLRRSTCHGRTGRRGVHRWLVHTGSLATRLSGARGRMGRLGTSCRPEWSWIRQT